MSDKVNSSGNKPPSGSDYPEDVEGYEEDFEDMGFDEIDAMMNEDVDQTGYKKKTGGAYGNYGNYGKAYSSGVAPGGDFAAPMTPQQFDFVKKLVQQGYSYAEAYQMCLDQGFHLDQGTYYYAKQGPNQYGPPGQYNYKAYSSDAGKFYSSDTWKAYGSDMTQYFNEQNLQTEQQDKLRSAKSESRKLVNMLKMVLMLVMAGQIEDAVAMYARYTDRQLRKSVKTLIQAAVKVSKARTTMMTRFARRQIPRQPSGNSEQALAKFQNDMNKYNKVMMYVNASQADANAVEKEIYDAVQTMSRYVDANWQMTATMREDGHRIRMKIAGS